MTATVEVSQGSSPAPRRNRLFWFVTGALVGAVITVGVVVLVASLTKTPSGLPPGTSSLSAFEQTMKADLVGPKSRGDFDVSGVSSVSCIMGSRWTPGEKFTCYAFRKNSNQLGTFSGVVLPTTPGEAWNADLNWTPTS